MSQPNKNEVLVDKVISGDSWNEFCDLVKSAGQFVIDNSAEDELERSEGFRYLARLLAGSLQDAVEPPSLTPPTIEYRKTRIGADNPDFIYASIPIKGSLSYKLTGRLNDCYQFNIGAFHGRLGSAQGLQSTGFLNQNDLVVDAQGLFTVIASAQAPQDQQAHWLPLCDMSNSLIIRQTLLNPCDETKADLNIEVVGGEVASIDRPMSAERLDNMLSRPALMVHGITQQFLGWTNDFMQRKNKITEIKPELLGMAKGDPNCQYNYGYFELAEGEALQIILRPPQCEYWNIQLANHWLESFDSRSVISAINIRSAITEPDGSVIVMVSPTRPDSGNWLSTQFHRRGVIALRWLAAAKKQPDPVTKLITLSPESSLLGSR